MDPPSLFEDPAIRGKGGAPLASRWASVLFNLLADSLHAFCWGIHSAQEENTPHAQKRLRVVLWFCCFSANDIKDEIYKTSKNTQNTFTGCSKTKTTKQPQKKEEAIWSIWMCACTCVRASSYKPHPAPFLLAYMPLHHREHHKRLSDQCDVPG